MDLSASSYSNQCQHCSTLECALPLGPMGLKAFKIPWTYLVSYVFSPPKLISLVLFKFLLEHVMCPFRLLIVVAPCWMEVPWLPTVFSVLAVISWYCPVKKYYHGCFSRSSADGSVISAFTHLAVQGYVVHRQGFSTSVCQVVAGASWASTMKAYININIINLI